FNSFKNHNFSLITSLSERQTKFQNNSDHGGNDPEDHTFSYPEIHPPSQETSDEVFQANHSIQNEESFENPFNKIAVSSSNPEEPPQDSDIRQLIRNECCVEVSEKQKIEDTMLELECLAEDNLSPSRKGIGFENLSYFEKAKDLRPTLYDEKVIGLGYTPMFLKHFDEALEIEKFKRSRENKIEFAYDYVNLNASYMNEKINFEDDYFQEIINPDLDKIDSPFQQTSSLKPYVLNVILEKIIIDLEDKVVNLLEKEKANLETIESLKSKGVESSENVIFESENQTENNCLVVEKECDKVENSKVIAPGMFKLNVSQCVSPISMSKSSCDSNNVEIKLKRKGHLDTSSSVRRPKNSDVIWKKKGSSNTSNVGLSAVSVSNLNKNVKRYSRKDLLVCNNSHLGETISAYMCNDAMNVSCDSRMNDLLDNNNFFIFDDVNVRISPVSKTPFRKKHRDSLNVRSKSNSNKSLPRTVHKWLPKMQPLAEPVAKWFPRVKRQIDKISKTPNSPGPIYKWVPKVC
nr:hypothetical protein [Tanacetum cinerariifolium]